MHPQFDKRLLVVMGGKGGVGKTLLCRILFFYFLQAKLDFAPFDADRENPEFHTVHAASEPVVRLFDFLNIQQTKLFITHLAQQQPQTVLIDMPAASSFGVREQVQRFDLLNVVAEETLGYRMTVISVLNNNTFTIASFSEMMEEFGPGADYVAVLSEMWKDDDNFDLWYNSPERQRFEALGGIEIRMPLLEITSFQSLHKASLPFSRAGELGLGDRLIIRGFLNRTRALFEPAAAYLSLPPMGQWVPISFSSPLTAPGSAGSGAKARQSSTAKSPAKSTSKSTSKSKATAKAKSVPDSQQAAADVTTTAAPVPPSESSAASDAPAEAALQASLGGVA